MRIDERFINSVGTTSTGQANQAGSTGSVGLTNRALDQGREEDNLSLSGVASLTRQAVTAGSEERAAYVEQIRAQYENGNLDTDANALAERLSLRILGGE